MLILLTVPALKSAAKYKIFYRKLLTLTLKASIIIYAVVLLRAPLKVQIENGLSFQPWRDDRVVEGARLESVCTGYRTEGSNPSLSAIKSAAKQRFFYCFPVGP